MITKDKGGGWFSAACDFCGGDEYLDDHDFISAVQTLKEVHGWKIYKKNGFWVHKCIECFKRGVVG